VRLRFLAPALVALALLPVAATAQVGGLSLEAGPAFLTKAGTLDFGTGAIESDAGFGVRVALRLGLGGLSLAGEFQTASQDYPAGAGVTPENLNARFVGITGAFHPITIVRFTPYAEFGVGRLFFSDESITNDDGLKAAHVGLGARLRLTERFGIAAGLRLQRQNELRVQGLADDFKYDPKIFTVLLTIQLG
jgi:hypothetical protein